MHTKIHSDKTHRRPAAPMRALSALLTFSMLIPAVALRAEAAASPSSAVRIEQGLVARGVPTIPDGSRVLMTGIVEADRTASIMVVNEHGAALPGVVVEANGEEVRTDENGRAAVIVPAAAAAFAVVAMTRTGSVRAAARVKQPTSRLPGTPAMTRVPSNPTPGSVMTIAGGDFDGVATGNTVKIGNSEAQVVASSPSELIVVVPADADVGSQPVTVETANGVSEPQMTEVTRIWFESGDTKLRPGEKGKGYIYVSGEEPKQVVMTNHNDVISFESGAAVMTVTTNGGRRNRAEFAYFAGHPGTFNIEAKIQDVAAGEESSDPVFQDPVDDGEQEAQDEGEPEEASKPTVKQEFQKAIEQLKEAEKDTPSCRLAQLRAIERSLEAVVFHEGGQPAVRGEEFRDEVKAAVEKLNKLADALAESDHNDAADAIEAAIGHLGAAAAGAQETPVDRVLDALKKALDRAANAEDMYDNAGPAADDNELKRRSSLHRRLTRLRDEIQRLLVGYGEDKDDARADAEKELRRIRASLVGASNHEDDENRRKAIDKVIAEIDRALGAIASQRG